MIYAKVVTLDGGYDCEQEKIRRDHKIGDVFEVYDIDMGSCHTDIYEGKDCYNSVYFEFFSDFECTKPYDIYSDPVFNPYLNLRKTKKDAAEVWNKNLEHLKSGGFGDETNPETLLNYWRAQYDAGYPYASENVKYFAGLLYGKQNYDLATKIIEEFKETAKRFVLDRGLYLVAFKNALNHAEEELKKKYVEGEK